MAKAGDFYEITLKQPHLEWGEYRYTDSRGIVYGEGYIPIPANIASANTKGIYNALNRQGFSLQADFWALLYVLDNNRCSQEFKSDMLSSFLELCDMYKINFFDFIEDVNEKRGHSINVESLKNLKIYDFHKKFLFIFKYFVENLL